MTNWSEYIRTVPDYPVEGINFYDLNSLFAGPKYNDVIDDLAKAVTLTDTPTHIVGVESRGFVLGAAVAYATKLPFVMVRKKGAKYPGELLEEDYTLEYGSATLTLQEGLLGHTDRVIIIDDLIATGGSMMATQRLVEKTGASVLQGLAIIDLLYVRQPKTELTLPTYSLESIWK